MTINVCETYRHKRTGETVRVVFISEKSKKIVYEHINNCCINSLYEPSFIEIFQLVKPTYVKYMNIYSKDCNGKFHNSRKIADAQAKNQKRIACIKVKFEEGQFDE